MPNRNEREWEEVMLATVRLDAPRMARIGKILAIRKGSEVGCNESFNYELTLTVIFAPTFRLGLIVKNQEGFSL